MIASPVRLCLDGNRINIYEDEDLEGPFCKRLKQSSGRHTSLNEMLAQTYFEKIDVSVGTWITFFAGNKEEVVLSVLHEQRIFYRKRPAY